MAQRIIVGLHSGADPARVREQLLSAGAATVSVSQEDVLVATAPSASEAAPLMERARGIAGVRYVEPDAWQSTL